LTVPQEIKKRGNAVLKRQIDAPSGGAPTENIWLLELSKVDWIQGRASTTAASPMQTRSFNLLPSTASDSGSLGKTTEI